MGIYFPDPVSGRGIVMSGSGITVSTAGKPSEQFTYVSLSSAVVLWPGQTYYVVSFEPGSGTGDVWYDNTTTVSTTSDASLWTAAYFDPSNNFLVDYGGAGGNHPIVPVDFKYNVGTPGANVTRPGSVYTAGNDIVLNLFRPQVGPLVSGSSVLANGVWFEGPPPGESITYQWCVDGVAVSPVLTSADSSLPWTFDSTTIADGTHVIYPRLLDATIRSVIAQYAVAPRVVIVHNSGFNNGAQTVPAASVSTERWCSPRPDFVHYDGVPNPVHTTYPMPYSFIAGSSDPAYRQPGTWYAECWCGPHAKEYHTVPEWATTSQGGVLVSELDALGQDSNQVPSAYGPVIKMNPMDGTRLNNVVSPFTNYIEDPAVSGKWWGVEISGRIFTIDRSGNVTTIVGLTRNRSVLTYPQADADPDSVEAIQTTVGTFPPGVDMGGANDICFDPRDSTNNTLYVACQVDNWIAKVNITTQTVTVYAGLPGDPGNYVDNANPLNARFSEPASLIMDGSGNLYVADLRNSAIRKIASPSLGTAGAVTTIAGGSTAFGWTGTPIAWSNVAAAGQSYNVSSITWNNGTMTGAVVMATPTNIKPGYTIDLSGATNIGGSGDPNIRYVVSAFTDSQHFTVIFEPNPRAPPSVSIGTIGGSPVFTSLGVDVFSDPETVTLNASGGQTVFPNVIRFTHNGNIVIGEGVTGAARLLRLNTLDGGSVNTISRIGMFDNSIETDPLPTWFWLDVDAAGTCGPQNDILLFKFQTQYSAAHYVWRLSLDGTYSAGSFVDTSILPTYASYGNINQGPGHYPWAVAFSKREGRIISTGTAQLGPVMWRIAQATPPANDPSVDQNSNTNIDQQRFLAGFGVHLLGTCNGFPGELRPAFWSLRGPYGAGFILNSAANPPVGGVTDTFEDLMHGNYASTTPGDAGDAALGAFIQAGMGGAVPRPEITGNDLRDYVYFIRRGTLQGSARATPVQPGPTNPDNAPPMITSLSISRTSSTTIDASWTTDKSTIGLVAGGSTTQAGLGSYPIFSALESGFGTSHSATLTVPSTISPVHVTVVVKDVSGNFSHSVDQVIT
jgi:hypothetical protein